MAGNKRWTIADINTLKNEYGNEDITVLANKLGRSVDAVHWKASQLNIGFKNTNTPEMNLRMARIERKLDLLIEVLLKKKTK